MSAKKHTPGPWNAKPCRLIEGAWTVQSEHGWNVGEFIVHLIPDKRIANEQSTEADAHLIAAAPALLAACKRFLAAADAPEINASEYGRAALMARDAIALAEKQS